MLNTTPFIEVVVKLDLFISSAFHFLSFFIIYKNAIELTLGRLDVERGEGGRGGGVIFLSFFLVDKTSASV